MSSQEQEHGEVKLCESDAFRANLVALIPFLRAFAQTLSGRREEADDLCQEALAKAWQARATFEPGTNLKAWLFVILRNQFYSEKRRAWRPKPWGQGVADQTLVSYGEQQSALSLSDLARNLRQLPDEQREALILVGAGGFSYEEAAGICKCAVGTIKSRVARARVALAQSIDGKRVKRQSPTANKSATADILAQLDDLVPQPTGDGLFRGDEVKPGRRRRKPRAMFPPGLAAARAELVPGSSDG